MAGSPATDGAVFQLFASGSKKQIPKCVVMAGVPPLASSGARNTKCHAARQIFRPAMWICTAPVRGFSPMQPCACPERRLASRTAHVAQGKAGLYLHAAGIVTTIPAHLAHLPWKTAKRASSATASGRGSVSGFTHTVFFVRRAHRQAVLRLFSSVTGGWGWQNCWFGMNVSMGWCRGRR